MDFSKSSIDLEKELRNEIERSRQLNGLPQRGGFIRYNFLDDLFTLKSLKKDLQTYFGHANSEEVEHLATRILSSGKRLYAILTLLGESRRIEALLGESPIVGDSALFNVSSEGHAALPLLQNISALSDISDSFHETQWVIPPNLSPEKHYSFPVLFYRFPFESQPKHLGYGSFGTVYEAKIARTAIQFREMSDSANVIVYKKVRWDDRTRLGAAKTMNEVDTLRARMHPNIIPLLASFTAGREKPFKDTNDQDQFLYMIFPPAIHDMKYWMDTPQTMVKADRRENIYKTMLGLASAVAYIHREIDGRIAFHGDLKPANILLFDTSPQVWKICDFGESNLKSPLGDTGTASKYITSQYAAPEIFFPNGRKHGRSQDIFALGCVFLELATILKHGWGPDGLLEFRRRKIENHEKVRGEGDFLMIDTSFHANLTVVTRWIDHLRTDGGILLNTVLDLILGMLCSQEERIFAWEVEVDLYILLNPNSSVAAIQDRLMSVVQTSRSMNSKHNPFSRAKRNGRPDWFRNILLQHGWDEFNPPGMKLTREPKVHQHYSTLPTHFSQLRGRQNIIHQLSMGFSEENCVGLYGLGGVGKTHIALQYAFQYHATNGLDSGRHTFWVNAQSMASISESYQEIAAKIGLRSQGLIALEIDKLSAAVNSWLEDSSNGTWIMVFDGLDFLKAEDVKKLLPQTTNGCLLVTTKNRLLLKDIVPLRKSTCILMTPPPLEELRVIFAHNLTYSILDVESPHTVELLHLLFIPLMVKMAANYMDSLHISSREMLAAVAVDRFSWACDSRVLEILLQPLADLPQERQLLGLLATLYKDGIDLSLLRNNFREEMSPSALLKCLGTLINCAFIDKVGDHNYIMSEFVQVAILAWINQKEGTIGLLRRYEVALSMLYSCYNTERERRRVVGAPILRAAYFGKRYFMQHFDRFLVFTRNTAPVSIPSYFRFREEPILAIMSFAFACLDQGRNDDAVHVLEFAHSRCESQFIPTVTRILVEAYLSHPNGKASQLYFDKAETLVRNMLKSHQESTEQTFLRSELSIELVTVLRVSGQIEEAWNQLRMIECPKIQRRSSKIVLAGNIQLEGATTGSDTKAQEEDVTKLQKLSIRLRHEEGLLHLSAGQTLEDSGAWQIKGKPWRAARQAFIDAKLAIQQWFPDEYDWAMVVDGDIAAVDVKLGSRVFLNDAERIFKHQLRIYDANFQHDSLIICAMKLRLATTYLKRNNRTRLRGMEDSLRRILILYQKRFGHDHIQTCDCAMLLRDALICIGKLSEAREIISQYPQMTPIRSFNLISIETTSGMLFAIGLGAFLSFFYGVLWIVYT